MNKKRKLAVITAGMMISLLAAGAMSGTGRAGVRRVLSALKVIEAVEPSTTATSATAGRRAATVAQTADVEQRARTRHGWDGTVLNTLTTGTIEYYTEEGTLRREFPITIYRKYPDKLRIEIGEGSEMQVSGFNGVSAWRENVAQITEEEARDIRAMLRSSPERLFVARERGLKYREPGRRSEDQLQATPWRSGEDRVEDMEYDRAEIEDLLGPATLPGGGAPDRRRINYLVERIESLVGVGMWLEPIDPRRDAESLETEMVAVRMEYGNWQRIGGEVWAMEIVQWLGGKVYSRILVGEIRTNQTMPDSLFER